MHYETPTDWKSEQWWRNRSDHERVFHLHVPPRIVAASVAHDLSQESADFLTKWKPGASLLLHGPSNTGKSIQAALLVSALMYAHPVAGRWIEADDYIEMLKDSFDNDGLLPEMYSSPHIVKYLKGVWDVIVLDGLGEERLTDFAAHELGSLIRKRYDRVKSTIITSSLSLADIKHRYGPRLAAVLADFDMVSTRGR